MKTKRKTKLLKLLAALHFCFMDNYRNNGGMKRYFFEAESIIASRTLHVEVLTDKGMHVVDFNSVFGHYPGGDLIVFELRAESKNILCRTSNRRRVGPNQLCFCRFKPLAQLTKILFVLLWRRGASPRSCSNLFELEQWLDRRLVCVMQFHHDSFLGHDSAHNVFAEKEPRET